MGRKLPPGPPATPGGPAAAPAVTAAALVPGRQVLVYTPDGPLGGTFTCTQCRAQAWQPDLLDHTAGCAYRRAAPG